MDQEELRQSVRLKLRGARGALTNCQERLDGGEVADAGFEAEAAELSCLEIKLACEQFDAED